MPKPRPFQNPYSQKVKRLYPWNLDERPCDGEGDNDKQGNKPKKQTGRKEKRSKK